MGKQAGAGVGAAPGGAGAGRYAPSPSGDLHLGNLRTAVLAWLFARHTGREFRLRVDDIDAQRSTEESATRQLADLAALGITHDGPIARESDCLHHYEAAVEKLAEQGKVYECYCSRKDIKEASRAPHAAPGAYPGTCRDLSTAQRAARRAELASVGRSPALRLRAGVRTFSVQERFMAGEVGGGGGVLENGEYTGEVDDMVLRRGGNSAQLCGSEYAYNLAVVVDDALAGVDQVVRGADLLASAPRQAYLAGELGLPPVEYVHVPLVLGPTGKRLAKRDGAVTMRELGVAEALAWVGDSLGEAVAEWAGRGGKPQVKRGARDVGAVSGGARDVGAVSGGARDGGAVSGGARGAGNVSVGVGNVGVGERKVGQVGTGKRVREELGRGVAPAQILEGWAEAFRPDLLPREPVVFEA